MIAERDISYVMDCVREGRFEKKDLRALIATIRGIPNSAQAAAMKRSLPWFSGSTFSRRRGNEFFKAAWFMVFDLDHIPDIEALKTLAVTKLSFLRYAFRSVRDGVKLVAEFASPITKEDDFQTIWKYLALQIEKVLRVEVDPTPDPARACFLSHDPDLLTNPNCRPLHPVKTIREAKALEDLTRCFAVGGKGEREKKLAQGCNPAGVQRGTSMDASRFSRPALDPRHSGTERPRRAETESSRLTTQSRICHSGGGAPESTQSNQTMFKTRSGSIQTQSASTPSEGYSRQAWIPGPRSQARPPRDDVAAEHSGRNDGRPARQAEGPDEKEKAPVGLGHTGTCDVPETPSIREIRENHTNPRHPRSIPPSTQDDYEKALKTVQKLAQMVIPYSDWYRIGLALYAGFGEAGRPLWDLFLDNPHYRDTQRELDAKWRSFRGVREITLATLFEIGGRYGCN